MHVSNINISVQMRNLLILAVYQFLASKTATVKLVYGSNADFVTNHVITYYQPISANNSYFEYTTPSIYNGTLTILQTDILSSVYSGIDRSGETTQNGVAIFTDSNTGSDLLSTTILNFDGLVTGVNIAISDIVIIINENIDNNYGE